MVIVSWNELCVFTKYISKRVHWFIEYSSGLYIKVNLSNDNFEWIVKLISVFFFFFLFVLIFEIKFCLLVFFPTKRNISKSGYILCCFGQFVSLFFNNPIGIKHTLNYSFVNSILFVQSCFLLLVLYQFYVKHTFLLSCTTHTRVIYI